MNITDLMKLHGIGQMMGDCASRTVLPPFGLSPFGSQAKPAATIARSA